MPTLSIPSASSSGKAYSPLSDEVNPTFGNVAPVPTVTRNGPVVYAKRVNSFSSTGSSDVQSSSVDRSSRTGSSETLSPKGKGRAVMDVNGYPGLVLDDQYGDLGEIRRGSTIKGKGKERAWDEEMGDRVEMMQGQDSGETSYPPLNDEEAEEKRIQDNLAKFAAKDMARRRAARLSKQIPTSPTPASPTSNTTSFMRRPFSMLSAGGNEGKGWNLLGMMGTPRNSTSAELPTTMSPMDNRNSLHNPYEPNGRSPSPSVVMTPTSPLNPSPFADPLTPHASRSGDETKADALGFRRSSASSSSTGPPRNMVSPPHSPVDQGFSYNGPGWRGGGAGAGADQAQYGNVKQPVRERWWHALCSWGSDLDGGHEEGNRQGGQAGRTNPFE